MLSAIKFRREENDEIGRYLVSEEDFDPGDIIFEEEPLVCVPCDLPDRWPELKFPFTCVGCLKNVTHSSMKCQNCSCPCCSPNCAKNDDHLMYECSVIAKMNIKDREKAYRLIMYIRIFLSRTKEPAKFEKFQQLSHVVQSGDAEALESFNSETYLLWSFLNRQCDISVKLAEARQMFSAHDINAFKVLHADIIGNAWQGEAIYYKSSLFANACSPNMEFSFFKSVTEKGVTSWNIRFHAKKAIKKGDMMTVCYSPLEQMLGTVARRENINFLRQFWCLCSRCLDPTEEDTYFQAVTCPVCDEGNLLPVQPIQLGSIWQCNACFSEHDASFIEGILLAVPGDPFYLIYDGNFKLISNAVADKFVTTRGGGSLSTNHYLVFQCAMHWIFGVKIRKEGQNPAQGDIKLFNKVMERIRLYLPVAVKLFPSDVIGRLQYIVVEALSYYVFHCKDMRTIEKNDLPKHYKMRIITRIVENLSSCLIWKPMKPNGYSFEKEFKELIDLHGEWSQRLNDLTKELEVREDGVLDALQNLFC